mmetsp:Transcript_9488/g.16739  ORF Transcript_9488/g.16739 Transcript_9488/m.16739 type:complete len:80 (-) Transcript_9488:172-411(-)
MQTQQHLHMGTRSLFHVQYMCSSDNFWQAAASCVSESSSFCTGSAKGCLFLKNSSPVETAQQTFPQSESSLFYSLPHSA